MSTENKRALTIKGITLTAPTPYAEGHVLTATEAHVLNQTFLENLRNNFASEVQAAIEAGETGNLQAKFDEYASTYSFGVRRAGGGGFTGDPVLREAKSEALKIAKELLKKKGYKLSEVTRETLGELVSKILAAKPELMEQARGRVAERASLAAGSGLFDE